MSGSSSTIRMRAIGPPRPQRCQCRAGSTMVNVLPCPGALSTLHRPPCASTMCRTIARPMPVPLMPCTRLDAPRTNFLKICSCSSRGMPSPPILHADGRRRHAPLRRSPPRPGPPPEYLTALSSRFHTARENASGSTSISASPVVDRRLDREPLAASHPAESRRRCRERADRPAVFQAVRTRAGFHPAEVQQRLDQPAQAIGGPRLGLIERPALGGGQIRVSLSRSVNCCSDVSGVRNSCDTAATKSDCS